MPSPKRGRGRPKGSKATNKAPNEKGPKPKATPGTKKGRGLPDTEPRQDGAAASVGDSWVDMDDSVLDTTGGISVTQPTAASAKGRAEKAAGLDPSAPLKKRGRPKGSKNRPKDPTAVPAVVTPIPPPVIPGLPARKEASKPKAASKKVLQSLADGSSAGSKPTSNGYTSATAATSAQEATQNDFALSALQHAYNGVSESIPQKSPFAPTAVMTSTPQPTASQPAEAHAGAKRKRAKPVKEDSGPAAEAKSVNSLGQGDALPNGTYLAGAAVNNEMDRLAEDVADTAPPSAKRQRKAKDTRTSLPVNRSSLPQGQSGVGGASQGCGGDHIGPAST